MKKRTPLKLLISLMAVCIAISIVACNQAEEEVYLESLTLVTTHNGAYVLGENINLSEITFSANYSDDTSKTVTLNDTMLSEEDSNKFFMVGTHTVIINYLGKKLPLQIEVVTTIPKTEYLAQFYSLGGTSVPSITTAVITAFGVPHREGYTFDGWYTDMAYNGDKAVEPYTLTANTSFYAKWIDNRICKVTFYDEDNTVLYNEEVHYGESIDVNAFLYPLTPVGKTFVGWNVTNGDASNVTVDLIVKASFVVDKCTVKISYLNTSGAVVDVERTYDYGEIVNLDEYTLPTKEGYVSRWVYYVNHAESEDETNFNEIPTDRKIALTEEYTTICAYFTVVTYDIVIYNGSVNQTEADLKSGNISLERVYENPDVARNFSVEWNTGFDFNEYTQDPNLSEPTRIYDSDGINGYTSQWCFVITLEDGTEVWYNSAGYIWNEESDSFIEQAWKENEGTSNWTLYDGEGNYIARVRNKILTEIKGELIVKAKYVKRKYTVSLFRITSGQQTRLVNFEVKYYTDFNPYDNYSYNPLPTRDVTGYNIVNGDLSQKTSIYDVKNGDRAELEQFYLIENTNATYKGYAGGYYSTIDGKDDWTIKWYTSSGLTEDTNVDFTLDGTVEVKENKNIYCQNTDNRIYDVYFYYNFDFNTFSYNGISYDTVVENQTVSEPLGGKIPSISTTRNGKDLSYAFAGWFDVPYSVYLKTGYRGTALTNFAKRTSSVYYYAHYECNTTYTVKIYDNTQSTAFIGKSEYSAHAVPNETIAYTLPAGSLFTMDMVYKGKLNADNSVMSGQTYYNRFLGNEFYQDQYLSGYTVNGTEVTGTYGYLLNKFGSVDNMVAVRKVLLAMLKVYEDVKQTIYDHDYIYTDAEYDYMLNNKFFGGYGSTLSITDFTAFIESNKDIYPNIYSALVKEGYTQSVQELLGSVDDFISDYVLLTTSLYQKDHVTSTITGFTGLSQYVDSTYVSSSDYLSVALSAFMLENYVNFFNAKQNNEEQFASPEYSPKYNTSEYYLNIAYDYDINIGEQKFSFSGWYTDSAYVNLYSLNFDFGTITVGSDVKLYAKWTDVTKGTEGLVYEEVDVDGNTAYVLVDFTSASEYQSAGYNNSNFYYATRNDNGDIPTVIGVDGKVEIQIPATIDKYVDRTTLAKEKADLGEWATSFTQFFILSGKTYVQAGGTFDTSMTYYQKETHPVIGIKQNAFGRYSAKINKVIIPLNLYFVEEGAFKNCYIDTFERTAAKTGESALDYVILDGNNALYQWDACPYVSIKGKHSNVTYNASEAKTIVGFAKQDSALTSYELLSGTTAIGKDAFFATTYLSQVSGVSSLVRIGDYAFYQSAISTLGSEIGVVNVPKTVLTLGEKAFYGCTLLKDFRIESGSALNAIGKDVLKESFYYMAEHYGVIATQYTDNNGDNVTIILGVGTFSSANYDKTVGDQVIYYDGLGNVSATGSYYAVKSYDSMLIVDKQGKLVNIVINAKVKFILDDAFNGSIAQKIYINDASALINIGSGAFASCASLTILTISGVNNAITLGQDVFYGRSPDNKLEVIFDTTTSMNNALNASWNQYSTVTNVVVA